MVENRAQRLCQRQHTGRDRSRQFLRVGRVAVSRYRLAHFHPPTDKQLVIQQGRLSAK
jgi:hypothetical protein